MIVFCNGKSGGACFVAAYRDDACAWANRGKLNECGPFRVITLYILAGAVFFLEKKIFENMQ